MDVFQLRNQLIKDYESYIRSFIRIKDKRIDDIVEKELSEGLLWPNPTAIDCYKRMNMSSICLKPDPQKDTVEFR